MTINSLTNIARNRTAKELVFEGAAKKELVEKILPSVRGEAAALKLVRAKRIRLKRAVDKHADGRMLGWDWYFET